MSILCSISCGWLLDQQKAIDDIYRKCVHLPNGLNEQGTTISQRDADETDLPARLTFRCLPQLFDILTPFMMNTQFQKLMDRTKSSSGCELEDHLCKPNKTKSKKRKLPLNKGEEAAEDYHLEVKSIIMTAADQLVVLGRDYGYLQKDVDLVKSNNNKAARQAAQIIGCNDLPDKQISSTSDKDEEVANVRIWGENLEEYPVIVQDKDNQYLLPPSCRFYMSDICLIDKLVEESLQYNLIVIDPPWENKSVKRLKRYYSLTDLDLLKLPVTKLAAEGCMIVVWVTNKQSQQQFVTETLFPSWGVQEYVRWYWLKVTRSGQPVYNMESQHKRPYEALLLGFVPGDTERCCPLLPADKVIISVPCSIHSRKPQLTEVLKDYVSKDGKCLELFARNLLPGWTSWGNEVLKYQHTDFYEQVT